MLHRHDYSEFSQPPSQWRGSGMAREHTGSALGVHRIAHVDFSPAAERADSVMWRWLTPAAIVVTALAVFGLGFL